MGTFFGALHLQSRILQKAYPSRRELALFVCFSLLNAAHFSEEKEKLVVSGVQTIRTSSSGSMHTPAGARTHPQTIVMPHRTGITSMGTVPNVGGGSWASLVTSGRNKKKTAKKEKKQKIRKEDISNPTNFQ